MAKYILWLAGLLVGLAGAARAQVTSFFVPPVLTNAGYATSDDSSYVALNPAVPTNGRLLVFLVGTNGKTAGEVGLTTLAANLGFHACVVAYKNTSTGGSICAQSADSLCYDKFRQQMCFGTPVSTIGVDTLHSIARRTLNLLTYLNRTYPAAGWGQFVVGGQVAWSKVVVGGHSQGSGHAMYLAKKLSCERAILFSGPDDASNYYQRFAHWLRQPGLTPPTRLYSLLHLQNETLPYPLQLAAARLLGFTAGSDTVDVDHAAPPYRGSHALYTNAVPRRPGPVAHHESTVVDYYTPLVPGTTTPLLLPAWTYMLQNGAAALPTRAAPAAAPLAAYPVPATGLLTVVLPAASATQPALLQAYAATGQLVLTRAATPGGGQLAVPLGSLAPGFYVLLVQQADGVRRCPFVVGEQ